MDEILRHVGHLLIAIADQHADRLEERDALIADLTGALRRARATVEKVEATVAAAVATEPQMAPDAHLCLSAHPDLPSVVCELERGHGGPCEGPDPDFTWDAVHWGDLSGGCLAHLPHGWKCRLAEGHHGPHEDHEPLTRATKRWLGSGPDAKEVEPNAPPEATADGDLLDEEASCMGAECEARHTDNEARMVHTCDLPHGHDGDHSSSDEGSVTRWERDPTSFVGEPPLEEWGEPQAPRAATVQTTRKDPRHVHRQRFFVLWKSYVRGAAREGIDMEADARERLLEVWYEANTLSDPKEGDGLIHVPPGFFDSGAYPDANSPGVIGSLAWFDRHGLNGFTVEADWALGVERG
jgi:hypothetical protein